MSGINKIDDLIITPTEEEQAAITGGRINPQPDNGSGKTIDPHLLHEPTRPRWDPGGPPQLARLLR